MDDRSPETTPTTKTVLTLRTARLDVVLRGRDETLAMIDALSPEARADVSPVWLAQLMASPAADPWTHGFAMVCRATGEAVGQCAFTGPPDADGGVEIAYGVEPQHEGKGYATEAAGALANFAIASGQVRIVRAHTRLDAPASQRILTKCGFSRVGEVVHPEDGRVLLWERQTS